MSSEPFPMFEHVNEVALLARGFWNDLAKVSREHGVMISLTITPYDEQKEEDE